MHAQECVTHYTEATKPMMIWVSEIHVQPRSHNHTRVVSIQWASLSHAFTLVIVTTVAFLVITAGAVAELACLACAYDPLAIAVLLSESTSSGSSSDLSHTLTVATTLAPVKS